MTVRTLAALTWGIAIWLAIQLVTNSPPRESMFVVLACWSLALLLFVAWDESRPRIVRNVTIR